MDLKLFTYIYFVNLNYMITNETDEKKTKLITLVSKKTNLSRKDFSIMKPEIRSLDTAERTLLKDSDAFLTAETSQTKKTSFELIKHQNDELGSVRRRVY